MKRIYLDYASTTPVDDRVLKAMGPFWQETFANPNSRHTEGIASKKALDEAREKIAGILQVKPSEIFFTSGGTESNNLAIIGLLNYLEDMGKLADAHIITSNIEHPSVLEVYERYQKKGLQVSFAPVDGKGLLDLKKFESLLKQETVLVSIMYVNNEIGTIEPLKEISKIIKKKNQNIIFHSDASQAPVYLPIKPESLGVDLMSLDGQKIYGPKGVGILYKRRTVNISPTMFGGDQEMKLRPGTQNLPLIVGFSKALETADKEREKNSRRVSELRDYFIESLLKLDKRIVLNGGKESRVANNVNISVKGENAEFLFIKLDKEGVSCATKSACLTERGEGSYVVRALGKNQKSGLRFTLGKETTREEIGETLKILAKILKI